MKPFSQIELLEARIAPAAAVFSVMELTGKNGFRVIGAAEYDSAGFVKGVGDLNGDGFEEFIVAAPSAGPDEEGELYVIFGRSEGFPKSLDLGSLKASDGFKILGGAATYASEMSGAGDVNGDGFDDLIMSAPLLDTSGSQVVAYVVFGKADFPQSLNLASIGGNEGFRVVAVGANGLAATVSGAGDFNGDGLGDVMIGVSRSGTIGSDSGAAYIIFGREAGFGGAVDLSRLDATTGLTLLGRNATDSTDTSVTAVGDVNGDRISDVIVSTRHTDRSGNVSTASYVVFGSKDPVVGVVDLSELDGSDGFSISGDQGDFSSLLVPSTAGDLNGDGLDDIIIGGYYGNTKGLGSGITYVVFGKEKGGFSADVDVSKLRGKDGFSIQGEPGSLSGYSVSAGDVNGDGMDDLVIGAPGGDDGEGGSVDGAVYVVYGKKGGFASKLDLAKLDGRNGYKITAVDADDEFGKTVSSADINGDGIADLVIGAPYARDDYAGESYVILSKAENNTLRMDDVDGDVVTLHSTKGALRKNHVKLTADGTFQIDLRGDAIFRDASITVDVEQGENGDGLVNVGLFNAMGIDLKKVRITGNLGMIIVGDDNPRKPALKLLSVGSLGTTEPIEEPLLSEFHGALGKLRVETDVRGASVEVGGRLGASTIGRDLTGDLQSGALLLAAIEARRDLVPRVGGGIPFGAFNATSVGSFKVGVNMNGGSLTSEGDVGRVSVGEEAHGVALAAAGRMNVVKIGRSLNGNDPSAPAVVAALARVGSATPADAVAIAKLNVGNDVVNAQILLGYQKDTTDDEAPRYRARNPDASAGKVTIGGDLIASSIVAGVFDTAADGFGQNDEVIEGDTTERISARIASIIIKGSVTGTAAEGDHYGITAQQIGKLTVDGAKVPLDKAEKDDIPLDPINGDFRLVEI
jgi:hypothetical protein